MDNEFKKVAKTSDFSEGQIRRFDLPERTIAIACVKGKFYAFDDLCTHADASLSAGCLKGEEVECPLHFARFNIITGAVTEAPAFEDLKVYEVKISDSDILVKII